MTLRTVKIILYLLSCVAFISEAAAFSIDDKMVLIPEGTYIPFYPEKKLDIKVDIQLKKPEENKSIKVNAFLIDTYPVTNFEYREFVKKNKQWRKSKIKRVFADTHYLKNWKNDLQFSNPKMAKAPVTFVSWFSAKAFCESKGKVLPTVDQWEYAAYDNGHLEKEIRERALEWYSKPNIKIIPPVGSTPKNGFGVYDLQGLIWEWVYDFNNLAGGDPGSFCGGSASDAKDSSDYVSFMRFAFRSSLKAAYTTANLGFRCAKEVGN
jgi:sulfatase modifying factor 1